MAQRSGGEPKSWKYIPLAESGHEILSCSSDDQVKISGISLHALAGGRLLAAAAYSGPGVRKLHGAKGRQYRLNHWLQSRILVSCDKGGQWKEKQDLPFTAPCLFRDGNSLYVAGHKGNLQIARSADGGETWSGTSDLSSYDDNGGLFVQSPAGVLRTGRFIYLCFMRAEDPRQKAAASPAYIPEILRAPCGADLLSAASWTRCRGIPAGDFFQNALYQEFTTLAQAVNPRAPQPAAWGHPFLCKMDEAEDGHETLLLLAQSGGGNHATAATVLSTAGNMEIKPLTNAAGQITAAWPCPGGSRAFDLFHDEQTSLYWLTGFTPETKATQKLLLWKSHDLINWEQAAWLLNSPADNFRCNMIRCTVRGNDLLLLALQSGCTPETKVRTRLMLHTLPAFREL